jgi:hypothetical protein
VSTTIKKQQQQQPPQVVDTTVTPSSSSNGKTAATSVVASSLSRDKNVAGIGELPLHWEARVDQLGRIFYIGMKLLLIVFLRSSFISTIVIAVAFNSIFSLQIMNELI